MTTAYNTVQHCFQQMLRPEAGTPGRAKATSSVVRMTRGVGITILLDDDDDDTQCLVIMKQVGMAFKLWRRRRMTPRISNSD